MTPVPEDRQKLRNTAWQCAGLASLGTGIVGIAVPLLPTTPFLLLAAFCFARGSRRLHDWLVGHPRYGPPIRAWRQHRAISRRAKLLAGLAMAAALAGSWIAGAPAYLLLIQAGVLAAVAAFLFSRPVPPPDAPR